jgi:hypothetical protein
MPPTGSDDFNILGSGRYWAMRPLRGPLVRADGWLLTQENDDATLIHPAALARTGKDSHSRASAVRIGGARNRARNASMKNDRQRGATLSS